MSPAHMLQYMCCKPSKLIESQKAISTLCHTHGVESVEGSLVDNSIVRDLVMAVNINCNPEE